MLLIKVCFRVHFCADGWMDGWMPFVSACTDSPPPPTNHFVVQKRRRRIDRSMIGEPTNFVHTAHVGSGDLFSGMNSVSVKVGRPPQRRSGGGPGVPLNPGRTVGTAAKHTLVTPFSDTPKKDSKCVFHYKSGMFSSPYILVGFFPHSS